MISTKGRYSIRILLDLAEHRNGSYIPMKDVAARQNISLKYIERLMPALKAAGLVDSVHGIGGGYRLTREPDQYTLWEILRLAEGDLARGHHVPGGGEEDRPGTGGALVQGQEIVLHTVTRFLDEGRWSVVSCPRS